MPVARVVARQLPWQPTYNVGAIVMYDCVKFGEIRFINMAVSGECPLIGWLIGSYHGDHLTTWAPLSCTIVSSLVKFGS